MIGCDIVAISRIERLAKRHKQAFLDKFLSPNEQALLLKPCVTSFAATSFNFERLNFATLAGLFAAKEAAAKALGVGICQECNFFDIEISKSAKGAPLIQFSTKVAQHFHIKHASLSISHEKDFAIAVCALEMF